MRDTRGTLKLRMLKRRLTVSVSNSNSWLSRQFSFDASKLAAFNRSRTQLVEQLEQIASLENPSEVAEIFNEDSLRQSIFYLLKQGDTPMAGRLMKEVIYKSMPWIDADGKLGSSFASEVLPFEKPSKELQASLAVALDIMEAMKASKEAAIPEFMFKLTLFHILNTADSTQLDRWIACLPQGISTLPPDQLEQFITRVYMKKRKWDRVREMLLVLQSMKKAEFPSTVLFGELFEALLQPDPRGLSFVGGSHLVNSDVPWNRLRTELDAWRAAGIVLGANGTEALEACLLKWMAPEEFLAYLGEWAGTSTTSPIAETVAAN